MLVAIAIPIFTSQLEKSRDSVSISNLRAAYAEASTAMLTSNGKAVAKNGNVTVAAQNSGTQVVTVEKVALKGQTSGFSGLEEELAFGHAIIAGTSGANIATGGEPGDSYAQFTFTIADGSCHLSYIYKTAPTGDLGNYYLTDSR